MHVEDVLMESSVYAVRVMRSVSFYCIVMQAICCLKFWNITKSVGTICIIVPTPNSGGLVSLSHVICAHAVGDEYFEEAC